MFEYDINRPIYFKLSESGHEALNRFYGTQKAIFLTHTKKSTERFIMNRHCENLHRFSVNLWILDIIFLLKVVFILKKYFK